jgi:hypothetical protein
MDPYQTSAPPTSTAVRWTYRVGSAVVLAGIVLGLGGLGWSQHRLEEGVSASFSGDPQAVLDAHAELARLEAFAPVGSTRDAGRLLNRHMALVDDAGPADEPVWWTAVSAADNAHIKENWLEHPEALLQSPDQTTYDDSILEKLLPYDHWNVASSGAWRRYLEGPWAFAQEQPIPNFQGLQLMGKVRLARGLREGELLPALREVRQLARFLLYGDDMVGSMVGLALFKSETLAAQRAMELGLLEADAWQPVPEADIQRLRKAMFDGSRLFHPGGLEAATALFDRPHVVGRCAMLEFAIVGMASVSPYVGRRPAPLEADFGQPLEAFDATLHAAPCAPHLTRAYAFQKASIQQQLGPVERLARLPYVRSFSAAKVMTLMVR